MSRLKPKHLREIAEGHGEIDEAMLQLERRIPGKRSRPPQGRPLKEQSAPRGGGRPSRAVASASLATEAPFPELFSLPARQLYGHIRTLQDIPLLEAAHQAEVKHLRRQTVLGWIEDRLRALGAPLGGPAIEPWEGYELEEDPRRLASRIEQLSPSQAAEVAAWEHYRHRRRIIMRACERVAGSLVAKRISETAPQRGIEDLQEPFPGYAALSTSPHARAAARATLTAQSLAVLQDAVRYEEQTKRRTTMLRELRSLIRAKER